MTMTDNENTDEKPPRRLAPGQRTVVWIARTDSASPRKLFETTDLLLEAPNWSRDGTSLLLNGDGALWRVDLDNPTTLEPVPLGGVPEINNDHVLSPDGTVVFVSAEDGHIYSAPSTGGPGKRLTSDDGALHFLHGVSPDGSTLSYVEIARHESGMPGRLAVMSSTGGASRTIDTGSGHIDGPEYSPDGRWIYLNSESFTTEPGHAQIARVPANGGPSERLVRSGTVDWFPHLAPDGRYASYLAYPAGTRGHPQDLDVAIHLVSTEDWQRPIRTFPLFGGQGTLNVNSWAPDSTRFAFVAYPMSD